VSTNRVKACHCRDNRIKCELHAVSKDHYVDTVWFPRYVLLVPWSGWTGGGGAGRVVRRDWFEGLTDEQRESVRMGMLERPSQRPVGGGSASVRDQKWAATFPLLCAYLADVSYADGTPRERATCRVFLGDDGAFVGVLADRANDRSLWATGARWDDLCAAWEAQLALQDPRWRYDGPKPSQRGRRK